MSLPSSRYNPAGLREVPGNLNLDLKDRLMAARACLPSSAAQMASGSDSARLSAGSAGPTLSSRLSGMRLSSGAMSRSSSSGAMSPQADRPHRAVPSRVADIAQDITDMFLAREKLMVRDPGYMANQTEINEKMRCILVDWITDVHLKFKLHEETFFLAIDLLDRYLAMTRVTRLQLQLVGITCVLLAAKYEELWAPEIKDCIHVSAGTYSRDEILRMERSIVAALSFKLTTPTPFPMLARLLEVTDADETTCNTAMFFLEHSVLDLKYLNFLPSQLANASLYLANLTLRRSDPWSFTLQYYSKARVEDFRHCAANLLEFVTVTTNSKYQAIRRKYAQPKYSEVTRMVLPVALPAE